MITLYTDGRNILAPKYRKFRPSRTKQLGDTYRVLDEVARQLRESGQHTASWQVYDMARRVERTNDRLLGISK